MKPFKVKVLDNCYDIYCGYSTCEVYPGAILTVMEHTCNPNKYTLIDGYSNFWILKEHVKRIPSETCIGGE